MSVVVKLAGIFGFGSRPTQAISFDAPKKLMQEQLVNNLQRGLDAARIAIINRTQAGRQIKGQRFKKYAESTKRQKEKLGRDPGVVDLTDSNHMLGAIATDVKIRQGGRKIVGRIYFLPGRGRLRRKGKRRRKKGISLGSLLGGSRSLSAGEKAALHMSGTSKMPKRPFFGLSKKQERVLRQFLRKKQ